MLRPSSRTEARKKGFKKATDADEARRKREEGMIQIRKDKREEAVQKKRRCSQRTKKLNGGVVSMFALLTRGGFWCPGAPDNAVTASALHSFFVYFRNFLCSCPVFPRTFSFRKEEEVGSLGCVGLGLLSASSPPDVALTRCFSPTFDFVGMVTLAKATPPRFPTRAASSQR